LSLSSFFALPFSLPSEEAASVQVLERRALSFQICSSSALVRVSGFIPLPPLLSFAFLFLLSFHFL
jgi:hypothetical protein